MRIWAKQGFPAISKLMLAQYYPRFWPGLDLYIASNCLCYTFNLCLRFWAVHGHELFPFLQYNSSINEEYQTLSRERIYSTLLEIYKRPRVNLIISLLCSPNLSRNNICEFNGLWNSHKNFTVELTARDASILPAKLLEYRKRGKIRWAKHSQFH